MYHPDRILYPMKRDPKDRGLDKWERISWDEATDLIVSKTEEIRAKYGSEAICVYMGTGREASALRLHAVLQGAAHAEQLLCAVRLVVHGPAPDGHDHDAGQRLHRASTSTADRSKRGTTPEWKRPDYVFCLGKEPLKSNPDGLWGHALIELMKRGSKLIMVDPRLNWLATRADQVLQIIPGTDAALCLAILNVLVNEDLVDHDFIDKWCYGYDELVERVQQYTPEFAAATCGIEADEIVDLRPQACLRRRRAPLEPAHGRGR